MEAQPVPFGAVSPDNAQGTETHVRQGSELS